MGTTAVDGDDEHKKDNRLSVITLDPGAEDVMHSEPSPPPPAPPTIPLPIVDKSCADDDYEEIKKKMHEPRYHTTTTVVETTEYVTGEPVVQIGFPKLDCEYIRTLGGIVKIICMVLCLLTFIFVMSGPAYYSGAGWATFVSSIGLFVTTCLLTLYMFKVVDTLPNINWIVIEMVFCFAWTIFFFIAACVLAVAAAQFSGTLPWAIAAFFAFGGMCAYGFDCYLKFLSWKHNEKASGGPSQIVIEQQRRSQNF